MKSSHRSSTVQIDRQTNKQTHHHDHAGGPRRHEEIARNAITRDAYLGRRALPAHNPPPHYDYTLLRNEISQEPDGQTLAFTLPVYVRYTTEGSSPSPSGLPCLSVLRPYLTSFHSALSSGSIRGAVSTSSQDPELPARSLRFPSTQAAIIQKLPTR